LARVTLIGLKCRIGLVYVPGALPCFEEFGGLPTDIVREDGLVKGKQASEVLDMLIIPGGSLVESGSIGGNLAKEIVKMAESGKLLLGICAGFQMLARSTDTGRLSPVPIVRHGLGLLDVDFAPLICTDRVTATVVGQSFIADDVGLKVTGFHCHTYGNITLHKDARPILVSSVRRLDYRSNPQDIVSGVANAEGNIVGVLVHALLDENSAIVEKIMEVLDITPEELEEIRRVNARLIAWMKSEVGISTELNIKKLENPQNMPKHPRFIIFTASQSGAGKTFILTGVAGALKMRGLSVGVLKIGGDVRDIVPALYLIKEPMKPYSSIRIGESGWKHLDEVVSQAWGDYDLILVEGAMSDFTGLLNGSVEHPSSTVEIALAIDAPAVIVVGCDKGGIESAVIDAISHARIMQSLGVNVAAVILNKVRLSYFTEDVKLFIDQAFKVRNIELLGIIPRMKFEERGMIPEVEIRYDDFGSKAIAVAEQFINLDRLITLAKPPRKTGADFRQFVEKFKSLLIGEGSSC
jgi:cobyric acid synthase